MNVLASLPYCCGPPHGDKHTCLYQPTPHAFTMWLTASLAPRL